MHAGVRCNLFISGALSPEKEANTAPPKKDGTMQEISFNDPTLTVLPAHEGGGWLVVTRESV